MRFDQRDAARRAATGLARGVLRKSNDATKMQEVEVDLLSGETISGVEFPHDYGFTSVPPDATSGGQAEVFVAFLGGNRSLPVALKVGDRRHRPKDWQPGEVGIHDDQGQSIHLTRDGPVVTVPSGKSFTVKAGPVSMKITESGVEITGGSVKHDGKRIDAMHTHGGIEPGGSKTQPPDD